MVDIAQLHASFLRSTGACTDTRQLKPGGMFFALKGPNFNANGFAQQALAGGCAFAVVDDPAVAADDRCLLVPDVLKALQALGTYHRRTFNIPVLAITGSNGKTTTKELVHAVLSTHLPTLATQGNLNNHIGVPLTLLRLEAGHRMAVIEMGANHVGDIHELVTIAEPTHGAITNIGRAHLEGFGGYAGVVRAKTEMYAHLRAHHGTAFVNADDALLMAESEGIERVTYGTRAGADLAGTLIPASGGRLWLHYAGADGQDLEVRTLLVGGYNLPNALMAACVARHFGVPDALIIEALEGYVPSNSRSQFMDTGRNQLVLDAYNANPSSMQAALENFSAMESDRPKRVILGDMLELGNESATEHQQIVDLLARLGLRGWLVGPDFARTTGAEVERFSTAQQALDAEAPVNALVLVKGSRGIKLETLLPKL